MLGFKKMHLRMTWILDTCQINRLGQKKFTQLTLKENFVNAEMKNSEPFY